MSAKWWYAGGVSILLAVLLLSVATAPKKEDSNAKASARENTDSNQHQVLLTHFVKQQEKLHGETKQALEILKKEIEALKKNAIAEGPAWAKEMSQLILTMKKMREDQAHRLSVTEKLLRDLAPKLTQMQNPLRWGYFEECFGTNGAPGSPLGKGVNERVFRHPGGGKKVVAVWYEPRGCMGNISTTYVHIMAEPDGDRIKVNFEVNDNQTTTRIRFHYLYLD